MFPTGSIELIDAAPIVILCGEPVPSPASEMACSPLGASSRRGKRTWPSALGCCRRRARLRAATAVQRMLLAAQGALSLVYDLDRTRILWLNYIL